MSDIKEESRAVLPLAIKVLKGILVSRNTSPTDKLKAIDSLIKLSAIEPQDELKALQVLVESGWVPLESLKEFTRSYRQLKENVKRSFVAEIEVENETI